MCKQINPHCLTVCLTTNLQQDLNIVALIYLFVLIVDYVLLTKDGRKCTIVFPKSLQVRLHKLMHVTHKDKRVVCAPWFNWTLHQKIMIPLLEQTRESGQKSKSSKTCVFKQQRCCHITAGQTDAGQADHRGAVWQCETVRSWNIVTFSHCTSRPGDHDVDVTKQSSCECRVATSINVGGGHSFISFVR